MLMYDDLSVPEKSYLHLKNSAKHISELQKLMYPKDNEREEVDEAGRKYMAKYYVNNPEEFGFLLENMIKYRTKELEKKYCEAFKAKENLKSIKSTEVFGDQGGSDVYKFGYHCQ